MSQTEIIELLKKNVEKKFTSQQIKEELNFPIGRLSSNLKSIKKNPSVFCEKQRQEKGRSIFVYMYKSKNVMEN